MKLMVHVICIHGYELRRTQEILKHELKSMDLRLKMMNSDVDFFCFGQPEF